MMRCLVLRGARLHLRFGLEGRNARSEERYFDLVGWEIGVYDRAPDNLRVLGYDALDDVRSLSNLGHADIFTGRYIDKDAFCTADFDIKQW